MTKPKSKTCDICELEYYIGFFGAGAKYCSRKCAREAKRLQYHESRIPTSRPCVICGRDIHSVGLKKNVYKYCSNRCMFLANKQKAGQKFISVKIPISEIPKLFSNK